MRKKLFTITLLASVLFATFSCKKDEVEEPTLTLSDVSVQLPKAASEKAITVTTNQAEWTALANADWIHLTQSGNTLTIKVDENLTTEKRTGEVAVLAVIGRKVVVEQEGSEVSIVTIPDKLEVDQWGGTFQFDVDANTKDWTIATDADWLKLTPKAFKGEVVVEIEENVVREARTAKLIFQAKGKATKEIVVAQSGIMFYILPYMEFGKSIEDIEKFELARKSELVGKPVWYAPYWQYETKSAAFDLIFYETSPAPDNKYKSAIVWTRTKEFFKDEMAGFIAFLKENGFEDKENNKFFNPEKNVEAIINDKATDPYVEYRYIPKQPKAYPTFEKFPYGLLDFTADSVKVAEYEKINGGTLNPEMSNFKPKPGKSFFHWYDVKKGDAYARAYFLDNEPDDKSISETCQYFSNQSLVFWENDGEVYITNEFMELAKKEGFEFFKINEKGWHYFLNTSKQLGLAVNWIKYDDLDIPLIDMHLFQYLGSGSINFISRDKKTTKRNKVSRPSESIFSSRE